VINISVYPVFGIISWVIIGLLTLVLAVWSIFALKRKYKHELYQIVSFVFLLLSISLPEILHYETVPIYSKIGTILAIIAFSMIFVGVITAHKRWVKHRGTTNLNSFSELYFYAFLRHPITLGFILLDIALIFVIPDVVITILLVISFIASILASYEKDAFLQKTYGYPYKLYMKRVPRFNFLLGIIRSIFSKEELT